MMPPASSLLPYGIALAAAAAPLISIRFVARRYLDGARDVWLLGLAVVGAVLTACSVSLPLGLIAGAVLARWRSWEQLPAVATWAGIIATWAIVQALPDPARAAIPWGWRLVMLGLIGMALAQRWKRHEIKATTGSRTLLAALLVLVWPFTHPLEWPAYAAGFWLTSSWIALAALLVAIAIMYPATTPALTGIALVGVVLFAIPWTRYHILAYTPRGGSLDGLHMRWRTWTAMLRVSCHWPTWLVGWGPDPAGRRGPSLEHALMREAVRLTVPEQNNALATSPAHCEPLELACTYGLPAVAAMGLLAWQLVMHVHFGDPWSAASIAGVVLACATIPARAAPIGVVWLITLAVVCGR